MKAMQRSTRDHTLALLNEIIPKKSEQRECGDVCPSCVCVLVFPSPWSRRCVPLNPLAKCTIIIKANPSLSSSPVHCRRKV